MSASVLLAPFQRPMRRFLDGRARRLRHRLNRLLMRYSELADQAVFKPESFAWTADLERSWEIIRAEAETVVRARAQAPPLGDVSPAHRRLDHQRRWRCFFLWGYGVRMDENCRKMPRTAALVERIPGLLSAMVSVHEPGTHLPRHRGPTKGHITCHLPLFVPAQRDKCRIMVDGRVHHWAPGRVFVFDDTFPHEVWNESEEDRVILLLHIRRPLRAPGRWLQDMVYGFLRLSPFVKDVQRNLARPGRPA